MDHSWIFAIQNIHQYTSLLVKNDYLLHIYGHISTLLAVINLKFILNSMKSMVSMTSGDSIRNHPANTSPSKNTYHFSKGKRFL